MANDLAISRKSNPVERTIVLKRRLIVRLNKEIQWERETAEANIKKIKFRIQLAQTLLTALEKGRK